MVRRAQALARPLCVAHRIVMGRKESLLLVVDVIIGNHLERLVN